jgi:hypothetical protein
MPSPVIVFDTPQRHFLGNRVFDREYAMRFPGALALVRLKEEAARRGWEVMTADVYMRSRPPSARAFLLSEMVSPYTQELYRQGVAPSVIVCAESPNVAWKFYHNLTRYSAPYRHAFLFRGVNARVKPPTQFHTLYWPNARRGMTTGRDWSEREYLVMVASNKQRLAVSAQKPLPGARRLAKRLVWNYLRLTDPLFRFEDLYQKRLDAISYFAGVTRFRLFGTGWEKPNGLPPRYFQAARRASAVAVNDKVEAMSVFKFALCFENCVFPGYVTEKIFDCFFAGCIPVYWGAPDIAEFVPAETFVDPRHFGRWADLDQYLRGMSKSEAQHYRDAARDFMTSKAFDEFHQDAFVNQLIAILESEEY